ncbi:MAG TPA: helix-turn-helix domain-containing GNAT family N-acetyltransferase [Casimicrobiaceae bacterium]|nr:helix-turn-helix domain-containing GNAT family N-acetyltransferase [Casimicrobiaceae bacterium]
MGARAAAGGAAREARITALRRFNRFYTQRIGVLREGLLQSPFSLAQVRVLYELAHPDAAAAGEGGPTATALAARLDLDEGYLSRILRGFERQRLVRRTPSVTDRRRQFVALTRRGRSAFAPLDRRSHDEIGAMLDPLSERDARRLVAAMSTIERLLAPGDATAPPIVLRALRPGDLGWVVHRHGAVYAREYGYDVAFEALVAEIAAKFGRHVDVARERCWIAECDGDIVGSVFLVRQSADVAKLRLLLVEPQARGRGVGARLVAACIRFARRAGYKRIVLWTQSELAAARRVYQRAGFTRTRRKAHRSFGRNLVAETWERAL